MPNILEFNSMTISWKLYGSATGGSVVPMTRSPYSIESAGFRESTGASFLKGFDLAREGLENYYRVAVNSIIPNEAQTEVRNNLLKPLNEYLKLASIGDIKNKVKKITEEAESFLIKESFFIEVTNRILTEINAVLQEVNIEYEICMFLSKDRESENAQEEIVIAIGARDISFADSINIWERIEGVAESILNQIKENLIKIEKYEDIIRLRKIDEMLSIEVKRI